MKLPLFFFFVLVLQWLNSPAQVTFQKEFAGYDSYGRLTADGGSIIFTYVSGVGGGDIFLNRVNPDGDTLWTMQFESPGPDIIADGCQTADMGFIITGYKTSPGSNH